MKSGYLIANISLGVSLGALAAAAILLVTRPPQADGKGHAGQNLGVSF